MEQMITIGAGKMGSLIAGEGAVSIRQTSSFEKILGRSEFVLLATRQEAGLKWLKANSHLLEGKTVFSLMAFVSLEALEKASDNSKVKFVRVMTDTSLKSMVWSDGGGLSDKEKQQVAAILSQIGSASYLGERNDNELLLETIKACRLGWAAQALDELASCLDKDVFNKVIEQHRAGLSFSDIASAVATKGGATEAGVTATKGQFAQAFLRVSRKQVEAGLLKAKEKSQSLAGLAQNL